MQSNDYKPGVSGWKLDKDGGFEINSASFGSASAVPEPQMIEIEVFNVRQDDLPTDPNDLAEMLSDAQRKAYDAGARGKGAVQLEFYTEDDPDFPTPRLRMFFSRPENIDELCARLKRAASQGASMRLVDGVFEFLHDGVVRMRLGNLEGEAEARADADQAAAESIAAVAKAATAGTHSATESMQSTYAIKLKVNEAGQYIAAGVGIHQDEQWSAQIATDEQQRVDEIRKVIADQLRPGGLLYRR